MNQAKQAELNIRKTQSERPRKFDYPINTDAEIVFESGGYTIQKTPSKSWSEHGQRRSSSTGFFLVSPEGFYLYKAHPGRGWRAVIRFFKAEIETIVSGSGLPEVAKSHILSESQVNVIKKIQEAGSEGLHPFQIRTTTLGVLKRLGIVEERILESGVRRVFIATGEEQPGESGAPPGRRLS